MGAWPPPFVGGGFLVAYAQLVAFYYAAGALLHFAVPAMMEVKSVQVEARRSGSVGRDALYSLGPLALKAGVWTVVEWMHSNGVGQLYDGPVSSVWHALYLLLTVAALDYLHDGWFYLTHRLLHWRPLYRHVHYIHHLSKQPSAFTGYSFHIVEALIVFANEVFVCLMFPLHIRLHRAYHLATTIIHQGGHAGYEIAPFIPTAVGLASLLLHGPSAQPPAGFNTVRHHDMHHRFPSRHFSLYFTHWDRWLGTLHPEYDASVAQHFRKARGQADGYVRVGEEEADCVVKRGTVDAADGAEPVLRMHSARSANGAGSPK